MKQAVGQAATYLVSDLISESYVGIPSDLFQRSSYTSDVCEAVGVGLFVVEENGQVSEKQHPGRKNTISSASLWGNRRNGAPDTNRLSDLKLAILALAKEPKTRGEIVSYIQGHRTRIGSAEPIKETWCQVFIDDATQMGLMIRRLDGSYVLSPLGKTMFEINPNATIVGQEKKLLWSSIFNFPVAYMVFRILKEKGVQKSQQILDEGRKLESEIVADGVFQTEFRKKYHLNEQRLGATLKLMKELGMLEITETGVRLSF